MRLILVLSVLLFAFFFTLLGQPADAQTCTVLAPWQVSAQVGPGENQVTLQWNTVPNVNNYTLVYGLESNKYIYGVVNLGNQGTTTFTVGALNPGTKYFFRVGAVQNCAAFSPEVSAVAMGKGAAAAVLATQAVGGTRTYTVQSGDTLSGIAEKFYGNMWLYPKIAAANNIANPNFILAGQVLTIP